MIETWRRKKSDAYSRSIYSRSSETCIKVDLFSDRVTTQATFSYFHNSLAITVTHLKHTLYNLDTTKKENKSTPHHVN